jgi:hypothetical protein
LVQRIHQLGAAIGAFRDSPLVFIPAVGTIRHDYLLPVI